MQFEDHASVVCVGLVLKSYFCHTIVRDFAVYLAGMDLVASCKVLVNVF